MRAVSMSFRVEMKRVICSAPMPWSTIPWASCLMSPATRTSSSTVKAWRMLLPMARRPICWSVNRSRSETTPTSFPSSTRATWRMRFCSMASAASNAGASGERPITPGRITDPTGRPSALVSSGTFCSRSCSVKMPSGRSCASHTSIEPTSCVFMRSTTWASGVSGAQRTGGLLANVESGLPSGCCESAPGTAGVTSMMARRFPV